MRITLFVILASLTLSFSSSAQKISGFYSGRLVNDSVNGMVQTYELALSEYRGKITGYSYVTFVKSDTFYYGIRRVKARVEKDELIVEDDKFIANNFPEAPNKGVGRIITIPLNGQDSLVSLNGRWKTTQTKKILFHSRFCGHEPFQRQQPFAANQSFKGTEHHQPAQVPG